MINKNLAGKTLVISGGSRGIGKAIATKAAKDGANIAILAKTAKPHPKLEGTIYSAAEEISNAGGNPLPIEVDIRSHEQIEQAIKQVVDEFHGIDICINNASAISLTTTDETTSKSFDLMYQVNTKGTFFLSQACLPYLKQAKNPHILNIAPPINLSPDWSGRHLAYTIAKYGMSFCVLGMAEELKPYGIAVNALWPKTLIATSALNVIPDLDQANEHSRKPEIVADSAYAIVRRDAATVTGQFFLDEEVLNQEGIESFDHYQVNPSKDLYTDLFLD